MTEQEMTISIPQVSQILEKLNCCSSQCWYKTEDCKQNNVFFEVFRLKRLLFGEDFVFLHRLCPRIV